jgi:hypothetical protein
MRTLPTAWHRQILVGDLPSKVQLYCRLLAGTAWLGLACGFYILLGLTWGFLSIVLILWELAALPTALLMFRWLRPGGGARVVAARLLLACCIALGVVNAVFFVPLSDWHTRLPVVVFWLTVLFSVWGAVLGFLGRRREGRVSLTV